MLHRQRDIEPFALARAKRGPAARVGADAVIDGDTVVVSSPDIQKPVAACYACICNPTGNKLYNKNGLPASPFRTDN